MMRRRLFQSWLLLFAVALLAGGPGSPLCTAAAASPIDGPTMTGCDMPEPAEKQALPAHPDCTSPCIGIASRLPEVGPARLDPAILPDTAMARLDGLFPLPEAEPPRS